MGLSVLKDQPLYNTHEFAGKSMLGVMVRDILADGEIDFDETDVLLDFLTPLARAHGGQFEKFRRQIEKARADGKITKAESKKLAASLLKLANEYS